MNFVVVAKKKDLLDELNFHLRKIPESKMIFEIKGAQVTLQQLRITRINASPSTIDSRLAVVILVDKDTLLTKVSAKAEVEIFGQLNFTISQEWKADANFAYMGHNWLENPDVNIGPIQFSVKSLIDNIIEKQKDKIEKAVNDQLKSFSDLSIYMNQVLPFVNQSIKFQTTQLNITPNIKEIIIEDIVDSEEDISLTCLLVNNLDFTLSSAEIDQAQLPLLIIKQAV